MALDFPSSPTVGDRFTSGTMIWEWDGTAWNIVTLFVPPIADDDQPTDPVSGQLWWNAKNGNLYVWYVDANSAQWVQTAGNSGQIKTAETRNRVCNPSMQISQENGRVVPAALATGSYWGADQWSGVWNTTGATVSCFSDAGPSPNGNFTLNFYIGTAGTLPAGGYLALDQKIEGVQVADFEWGTADAAQAVVRFWAKGQAGKHSFVVRNGAMDRCFIAPIILAASGIWQEFVVVVPGDTTGTWAKDNSAGIEMLFGFGAGSGNIGVEGWQAGNKLGLSGQFNGAGVATAGYAIADIGFYRDPEKTGKAPPFETPDYSAELLHCQRYWRWSPSCLGTYQGSTVTCWAQTQFSPAMRADPVMSLVPGKSVNELGIAFRAVSAVTGTVSYTGSTYMNITTAAASAVKQIGAVPEGVAKMDARM